MAEQSHLEKLQNLRHAMVERRRESIDAIIERGALNKTFLHDVSLYREAISLQDIVEGLDRIIVDERTLFNVPSAGSDFMSDIRR